MCISRVIFHHNQRLITALHRRIGRTPSLQVETPSAHLQGPPAVNVCGVTRLCNQRTPNWTLSNDAQFEPWRAVRSQPADRDALARTRDAWINAIRRV